MHAICGHFARGVKTLLSTPDGTAAPSNTRRAIVAEAQVREARSPFPSRVGPLLGRWRRCATRRSPVWQKQTASPPSSSPSALRSQPYAPASTTWCARQDANRRGVAQGLPPAISAPPISCRIKGIMRGRAMPTPLPRPWMRGSVSWRPNNSGDYPGVRPGDDAPGHYLM